MELKTNSNHQQPVTGCKKRYKNVNGAKYHTTEQQQLKLNAVHHIRVRKGLQYKSCMSLTFNSAPCPYTVVHGLRQCLLWKLIPPCGEQQVCMLSCIWLKNIRFFDEVCVFKCRKELNYNWSTWSDIHKFNLQLNVL